MKILVFGSNGWIGKQFLEILKNNNINYVSAISRANDFYEIEKEIGLTQPSHIVSFIGRTHGVINNKKFTTIDYLEEDGKLVENIRDNLFSPILLLELCKKNNIHYTYLGTGCIFKYENENFGMEKDGFVENSEPNFFGSSYSIVKGFTDKWMNLFKDNVLNLRIRMPITGKNNPRNFITKI